MKSNLMSLAESGAEFCIEIDVFDNGNCSLDDQKDGFAL